MRNTEIKFEIVETIGVIGTSPNGWTKELNIVAWNGYPPKYDLRQWSPDRSKFGKGFTFTNTEAEELLELLEERLIEDGRQATDVSESDKLKALLLNGYFKPEESEDDEDDEEC